MLNHPAAVIPDNAATDRPVARPKLTRRLLALGVVAAVVVAAAITLSPALRRWIRAERVVDGSRLRIAEVVRGDLERDVAATGRVVAALHPTLFSPVQGIVALSIKAGDQVTAGQVLARLDSPELASRLTQERATLSSAEAELGRAEIAARQAVVRTKQTLDVLTLRHAAAERGLARAKALFEQGLVNVVDREKAEDDLHLAELELGNARETAALEKDSLEFETRTRRLQVERQRAIVADLERQVAELAVTAPFDGLVATVTVHDRDAVARNQALLSVVNLSALEIEVALPENYAGDVAPGTPAEIAYGGANHPGRVTTVAPEVVDSQVRVTVAFTGTPPGLRQNERVSVRLVLERRADVLKLPRGPFLEAGGGRQAYVIEDGVAVKRSIEVGATSVSEVEIKSGLAPGDRVVISDTSPLQGADRILVQ